MRDDLLIIIMSLIKYSSTLPSFRKPAIVKNTLMCGNIHFIIQLINK